MTTIVQAPRRIEDQFDVLDSESAGTGLYRNAGNTGFVHRSTFSQDTVGPVPGPTAAEVAANKVLRSDGTWATLAETVSLDGLSDATITTNTSGEILKWNGSAWINNTLAEAGIATASHSHEGTAVLSTGESGGTKFLREDGDGTCSWQVAGITTGGSVNELLTDDGSGGITSNSTVLIATGNLTLTDGKLAITNTADEVNLTINGVSGQSANLAEYNPNGVATGASARITADGEYSNTRGVSGAESFGANAKATANSVSIGANAGGYGATGASAVNIGWQSGWQNTGGQSVAVGAYAGRDSTNAIYSLFIGYNAQGTTATSTQCCAIGGNSVAPSNTFVAGSANMVISDVYFGQGVTSTTETGNDVTIHGTATTHSTGDGGGLTLIGGSCGGASGDGGDLTLSGGATTGGAVGKIICAQPLGLPSYAVAGLPSAATAGQLVYISDETGGAVVAFSDGTDWRRVTDRAIAA